MDVKVEVGTLNAGCVLVESQISVEILSGVVNSPEISNLSFTPIIFINGSSISAVPADNLLIGVKAA